MKGCDGTKWTIDGAVHNFTTCVRVGLSMRLHFAANSSDSHIRLDRID